MASANYFGTQGQLQPDILSAGRQFNAQTISSGAITYTYTLVTVSAESGTTDDLLSINSAEDGNIAILKAASGHTITVKNTVNIAVSADTELSGDTTLALVYDGTNWLPIAGASAGGGGGTSDISVYAYRATTQSISSGVATAIQWNIELFDTDTMHDTSTNPERITFTTAGKYQIEGQLTFGNSTSGYRVVYVYHRNSAGTLIRGTRIMLEGTIQASTFNAATIPFSFVVNASATDYVEVVFVQNSGTTMSIYNGSVTNHESWISAHKID